MSKGKYIKWARPIGYVEATVSSLPNEYICGWLNMWAVFSRLRTPVTVIVRDEEYHFGESIEKNRDELYRLVDNDWHQPNRKPIEICHYMKLEATRRCFHSSISYKWTNDRHMIIRGWDCVVQNFEITFEDLEQGKRFGQFDLVSDEVSFHMEWTNRLPYFYYLTGTEGIPKNVAKKMRKKRNKALRMMEKYRLKNRREKERIKKEKKKERRKEKYLEKKRLKELGLYKPYRNKRTLRKYEKLKQAENNSGGV